MSKIPKNVKEQIELLKSRNMKFQDEQKAEHLLLNVSYYRLKGYWWEMQSDKKNHYFYNDCSFEKVDYYYNFDRRFRALLFGAIERIEIALRTKMIYYFSLSYGAEWYLNPSLFQNRKYFYDFKEKIQNDLNHSTEEFIKKHYENHPNENPECWKAFEIITLGALSKLFENLHHQLAEKNLIAQDFGLHNKSIW